MPQTTVSSSPAVAKEGLLYDAQGAPDGIVTGIVDESAGIKPGRLVVRTATGDWSAGLPDAAITADPDAIIAAHATVAAATLLDGTDLDGATGEDRIYPPAKLTLTLSSHADFDLSSWPVIYEDEDGKVQTYNFPVPDAGNVTLTTPGYASRVISLLQPTQAGTGGSFQLGTSAARAIGSRDAPLGVSLHSHKALALAPSSSNNETYEDGAEIPLARRRRVWVKFEDAFDPTDSLYVRVASGTGEEIGAFRTDADSNTAVLWTGARILTSGAAAAFGVIEIDV